MSGFSPVATIIDPTKEEYEALVKQFGYRVSLKGMWSWNGELVDVESFEEIDKLNDDDEAGHEKLMNSNRRD